MFHIKNILSYLNRERKKKFSTGHVSQKKFDHLTQKYTALVNAIASTNNTLKKQAQLTCIFPVTNNFENQELCLFVSYSAAPHIKPHVAHHIQALTQAGIRVVLIINTDQPDAKHDFSEWSKKLDGLFIRENIGFDFGAWSHIYSTLCDKISPDRLYLANDSMIGPLSESMFEGMLKKIRESSADMLGLTANQEPIFHLQSFFLVFSKKIQQNKDFQKFLKSLWQLPSKDMVIDFYETRITRLVELLGYSTEAIYKTNHTGIEKSDAVIHSLDTLLSVNFPYIKTSMAHKASGKLILDKYLPELQQVSQRNAD
jgi:lipopolysaccharide biosynthesis protein